MAVWFFQTAIFNENEKHFIVFYDNHIECLQSHTSI